MPAQMPVPAGANFEGSSNLTCDPSGNTDGQGDCHLLVVDRDDQKLYEVYQGTTVDENIAAQGLFVWDLNKQYPQNLRGDQCTSADAAGFPIAALTPTADEVAAGVVPHALRFILPNDRMKAPARGTASTSAFARYAIRRGHVAPITGMSIQWMWLTARTAPPSRGIRSAPYTLIEVVARVRPASSVRPTPHHMTACRFMRGCEP